MREAIRAQRVPAVVVDARHGEIPSALLFPATQDRASAPRDPGPKRPAEERFETLSWTSEQPLSLPRLQQAIGRLAPKLARAKGLFETIEQPGRMEYGSLAIAAQRRRRKLDDLIKNTPADGLVMGVATVNAEKFGPDGARCIVVAYDYTVLAGTQGHMGFLI